MELHTIHYIEKHSAPRELQTILYIQMHIALRELQRIIYIEYCQQFITFKCTVPLGNNKK